MSFLSPKYKICREPTTLLALAVVASAGGSAISASKQAKTAREAIASQERTAANQLEAAKEGEALASQTAKNKLKLRQASQTKTILTNPLGLSTDDEQINSPTLGV